MIISYYTASYIFYTVRQSFSQEMAILASKTGKNTLKNLSEISHESVMNLSGISHNSNEAKKKSLC
jgi:hypothetical protein